MKTNVKSQPDGYHTLTPYLIISGAARAMDFYQRVFKANETVRMPGPEGKVLHAEMKVGDSVFMLADENPQMGFKGPHSFGGTPLALMIYVDDVDAIAAEAIAAGAKALQPVKDQFYGDRSGTFQDPFGHIWTIATHIEDVPPEEMEKRMAAACA